MWQERYSAEVEALIRCARQAWQRGLTAGSGGNFSCRVAEGILITCSGSSFRTLRPEDMLLIDADGAVLAGDKARRPSIESGFHWAIYRARASARAVCHLHPIYCCCYACQDRGVTPVSESGRLLLGQVATVAAAAPGSPELAAAVSQALTAQPEAGALVLLKHGIVTWERDLDHAYDKAELLEAEARMGWVMVR